MSEDSKQRILKIRRGANSVKKPMPTLEDGELGLDYTNKVVYIGYDSTNYNISSSFISVTTDSQITDPNKLYYIDGTLKYVQNNKVKTIINFMTSITYSELSILKESNELVPGMKYRITDFKTTSNSSYKSAGHQFDIILTALTTSTFDTDARAINHDFGDAGSDYFENSNLNKWEIKYDFDGSSAPWSSTDEGTGAIIYMKDEFNNEAGYDFKNILIPVYKWDVYGNVKKEDDESATYTSVISYTQDIPSYIDTTITNIVQDTTTYYAYSFCKVLSASNVQDASLYNTCSNNKIGGCGDIPSCVILNYNKINNVKIANACSNISISGNSTSNIDIKGTCSELILNTNGAITSISNCSSMMVINLEERFIAEKSSEIGLLSFSVQNLAITNSQSINMTAMRNNIQVEGSYEAGQMSVKNVKIESCSNIDFDFKSNISEPFNQVVQNIHLYYIEPESTLSCLLYDPSAETEEGKKNKYNSKCWWTWMYSEAGDIIWRDLI